jgi:hypothetical protein
MRSIVFFCPKNFVVKKNILTLRKTLDVYDKLYCTRPHS